MARFTDCLTDRVGLHLTQQRAVIVNQPDIKICPQRELFKPLSTNDCNLRSSASCKYLFIFCSPASALSIHIFRSNFKATNYAANKHLSRPRVTKSGGKFKFEADPLEPFFDENPHFNRKPQTKDWTRPGASNKNVWQKFPLFKAQAKNCKSSEYWLHNNSCLI